MTTTSASGWNEDSSAEFIDTGRYFVPERELQMDLSAGQGGIRRLDRCALLWPGTVEQSIAGSLSGSIGPCL
jgi:hypothetical protein